MRFSGVAIALGSARFLEVTCVYRWYLPYFMSLHWRKSSGRVLWGMTSPPIELGLCKKLRPLET